MNAEAETRAGAFALTARWARTGARADATTPATWTEETVRAAMCTVALVVLTKLRMTGGWRRWSFLRRFVDKTRRMGQILTGGRMFTRHSEFGSSSFLASN